MEETTLGTRLKELLDENGITQQKLAEQLYISSGALNGYVQDNRKPEYATLIKLSQFFHTSCDYLIGNSTKRHLEDDSLSPNEDRLVELYRKLSPEAQACIMEQLVAMYKNFPAKGVKPDK